MDDEDVLDLWVSDWMAANPFQATPFAELSPELLELARGPIGFPPTVEIDHIEDQTIESVPVRIYRDDGPRSGLIVYIHGGGYCIGSIGLMDNVARSIAKRTGAVVVSVGYRLAPENPYPAGLEDCEAVTRWALANTAGFGVSPSSVLVAGESAGGNLSAAVSLRLRDAGVSPGLAGQVLIYPGLAGSAVSESKKQFDGLIISLAAGEAFWGAYAAGRDLDDDPYAAPLNAKSLAGLPPALVLLGGCDMLRDEGRAYARRLAGDGVEVDEVCYPGQPHGFVNFDWPVADQAFDRIGTWVAALLARTESP